MNTRQANRRVVAARAAANGRTGASASTSVSRNPAARVTEITPLTHVRNRKAVRMTAAQRDSEGNRSAWARSPYFFTEPRWDQTVTSQHVGEGGYR